MFKKIILIVAITTSLFAQVNGGFDAQPPKLNISCSIGDASFTLYKDTKCTGGGTDLFKPRCVEYILKKAVGLDVSEAVYYNNKEAVAYLEKECAKKKNSMAE